MVVKATLEVLWCHFQCLLAFSPRRKISLSDRKNKGQKRVMALFLSNSQGQLCIDVDAYLPWALWGVIVPKVAPTTQCCIFSE